MNDFNLRVRNDVVRTFTIIQLNEVGYCIYVSPSTFNNCQNFTISPFENIIRFFPKEQWLSKVREIKQICSIDKPFLIVDVERRLVKKIKETFNVVKHSPYTNANYSAMSLMIIDTRLKSDSTY